MGGGAGKTRLVIFFCTFLAEEVSISILRYARDASVRKQKTRNGRGALIIALFVHDVGGF